MSVIVFGIPIKAVFDLTFLKGLVKAMTTPEQWNEIVRHGHRIHNTGTVKTAQVHTKYFSHLEQDEWEQHWVDYLFDIVTTETDDETETDTEDDSENDDESVESEVDLGPGFGLGVGIWFIDKTDQVMIGVVVETNHKESVEQVLEQVPRLYEGDMINRFGKINPRVMDYFAPYVSGPIGYYKIRAHICANCRTYFSVCGSECVLCMSARQD